MKLKLKLKYIVIALLLVVVNSCIEEVEATPELDSISAASDILVVDARLTDELKRHQVELSRIFPLDSDEPVFESGAQIVIVDDLGDRLDFVETSAGIYTSSQVFAAQQNRSYQLEITLTNGEKYTSTTVPMPVSVPIGELEAKRMLNDREEEGVGVFVDNSANGDQPTFFRYEYEETYKIIAPNWDPFRLRVVRYAPCFPDPFVVDIIPWEDERRICYGSNKSQRIIQASSDNLNENTINNFQLHFISRDNYIISHRYSMNVTQFALTSDAYSFYERLDSFSSSDNLFSQVQPGFLEGNITLESNPEKQALGFFEVSSISKKRMYFNYEDLFPGEELPPYPVICGIMGNPRLWPRGYHCASEGVCDGNCDSPLIEQILAETVVYAQEKEGDGLSPYYTWPSPCGDCTKLGSNVVPDFWEE